MADRVLDDTALTEPVSRDAVSAWRAQVRASGVSWADTDTTAIMNRVLTGCVALVLLFGIANAVAAAIAAAARAGSWGAVVAAGVILIVVTGVAAILIRRARRRGGRWTRWYRMTRFAQANGLTFAPTETDPDYGGEIFQLGTERVSLDHFVSASGRYLDFGNYRWVTGSGRNRTTHTWGFLALHLDRQMPNMVLDAKANNSLFGSNLPEALDRRQILHLEGDFDRHFTLYCPKEYEADALYVFTPDLMALLIDEAAPFDVELADDWMFVYSSQPFDLTDPTVFRRLFRIVDTVGSKAVRQTARYADARIGDPAVDMVAHRGARLKRRVPIVAELLGIAFVIAFAVVWFWSFFGPITGWAGR